MVSLPQFSHLGERIVVAALVKHLEVHQRKMLFENYFLHLEQTPEYGVYNKDSARPAGCGHIPS